MPQLPSGKHIAIQATGFDALYDEAFNGTQAHKLMQIQTIADLYPYVEVIYFVHDIKAEHGKNATGPQAFPAGLRPAPGGYSLVAIQHEFNHWSRQDRKAFQAYLESDRIRSFFAELLEDVKQKQEKLLKEGPELGRFLALCWKTGAHPLQE
jgi:hypothetical protein